MLGDIKALLLIFNVIFVRCCGYFVNSSCVLEIHTEVFRIRTHDASGLFHIMTGVASRMDTDMKQYWLKMVITGAGRLTEGSLCLICIILIQARNFHSKMVKYIRN